MDKPSKWDAPKTTCSNSVAVSSAPTAGVKIQELGKGLHGALSLLTAQMYLCSFNPQAHKGCIYSQRVAFLCFPLSTFLKYKINPIIVQCFTDYKAFSNISLDHHCSVAKSCPTPWTAAVLVGASVSINPFLCSAAGRLFRLNPHIHEIPTGFPTKEYILPLSGSTPLPTPGGPINYRLQTMASPQSEMPLPLVYFNTGYLGSMCQNARRPPAENWGGSYAGHATYWRSMESTMLSPVEKI